MRHFTIGLDYGTNSVRALIVDAASGAEVGASVFNYPSGDHGILLDPRQPDLARQHPQDYLDGLVAAIKGALAAAAQSKGVSPAQVFDEGEFPDVLALRDRWVAVEAHRAEWWKALPEDAVSKKLRYKNLKGEPFEGRLWELVQHVVNHSSYHRGQVVTLLRQLGAKPPATDLVAYDREQRAKAARG